jgi:hypothetical protein
MKHRFQQGPYGATSQNTVFFIFITVKGVEFCIAVRGQFDNSEEIYTSIFREEK